MGLFISFSRESKRSWEAFSCRSVEKNSQVGEKKVAAATALLYMPRSVYPK
jgi:hypothetical protein